MATVSALSSLLIRLSPHAICEMCIADRLELSFPGQANAIVGRLNPDDGYERFKGPCALCGMTWLVTRFLQRDCHRGPA